jgi:hypothetical protein
MRRLDQERTRNIGPGAILILSAAIGALFLIVMVLSQLL